MGKGRSADFTAEQVHEALRALPQSVADTVEEQKGDLTRVVSNVEAAVRHLDPTGTLKKNAIERGLELWDAKHHGRLSEKWDDKEASWAGGARALIRAEMQRVNKVSWSQKKRDADAHLAAEPAPKMKKPAAAEPPPKEPWDKWGTQNRSRAVLLHASHAPHNANNPFSIIIFGIQGSPPLSSAALSSTADNAFLQIRKC